MRIRKSKKHTKEIVAKYFGKRIYFGPFSGLKIPDVVLNALSITEILGFYESCLHFVFSDLLNRKIKNVIIIGGNNGYYSAGLSNLFNPESLLIYETVADLHPRIASWFEENSLSNYKILGEATPDEFKKIDRKIDFLLMDCEGFEKTLLDPDEFVWQRNSDIIVELHPFYKDNLISDFTQKFHLSHNIQIIYDDFNENIKVNQILEGLKLNINYDQHPSHRWINENGNKIYTSGIFLYLKRKSI
jgi:hypothetical protein